MKTQEIEKYIGPEKLH